MEDIDLPMSETPSPDPTLRQWLVKLENKLDDRDERLQNRLSRIDKSIQEDLKELREGQKTLRQTIFGPTGNNGMYKDVRVLKEQQRLVGTVSIKVAITAVIGVATIVATLTLGLA